MNELFEVFIAKSRRKKELQIELKALNEDLTGMQDDLIEDMSELGVENFKTADGETLYIHTRVAASPRMGKENACGALRLAGYGDLVSLSYSPQSVSSLVKELEENGQLDEDLAEAFKVHHIHTVRVRGLKIKRNQND